MLAQLEQVVAGTRRIGRGEVGWIGVGYVGSAMNLLMPPVLRRFHAEHPGVEVLLYEMLPFEQSAALLDRRVHVSFARPGIDHGDLAEESLYEEPVSIALPSDHRWAGRSEIAIAELVDEPVVLYGGRMTRGVDSGFLTSLFRAAGVEPKVAVQSQYAESALGLVAAGMGVALTAAGFGRTPRAGVTFVPVAQTLAQHSDEDRLSQDRALPHRAGVPEDHPRGCGRPAGLALKPRDHRADGRGAMGPGVRALEPGAPGLGHRRVVQQGACQVADIAQIRAGLGQRAIGGRQTSQAVGLLSAVAPAAIAWNNRSWLP